MMKHRVSRHALALLLATVSGTHAAELGKHSPYVIGPVVRNLAEKTIVIPVHYYWKKGDGNTETSFKVTIEFGGKSHEIRSSDIFITASQSGWQSVVSEFTIRGWRPTLGAAGTFPVSDLEPAKAR